MKPMKTLASYYRNQKQEALFTGVKATLTSDPELKRLYKQKQQLETEHKAHMQKYKMAMDDINESIARRKDSMKGGV